MLAKHKCAFVSTFLFQLTNSDFSKHGFLTMKLTMHCLLFFHCGLEAWLFLLSWFVCHNASKDCACIQMKLKNYCRFFLQTIIINGVDKTWTAAMWFRFHFISKILWGGFIRANEKDEKICWSRAQVDFLRCAEASRVFVPWKGRVGVRASQRQSPIGRPTKSPAGGLGLKHG